MDIGKHVIIDLTTDSALLKDATRVCEIFKTVAIKVGCSVLFERSHTFPETNGFTAIIGLAESHISIHTWPEHNFAAIDIFMCGENDALKAADMILDNFENTEFTMQVIGRKTD